MNPTTRGLVMQNVSAGSLVRQDAMGTSEIEVSSEVQAGAMEAQARAEVQARWAIAQRAPRNLDAVRVALLKECDRPGFAECAKYLKPVGGQSIIGPSIRFVETALRCMRNVIAATTVISEDRQTRRLQVMVTDLETNVSWPRQITIEKTVERRNSAGRTVVYERTNTQGQTVYVVLATEDELANKEAAAVSKAIRTAGLRVIPGDLVEEALARVDQVRSLRVKTDPAGERKKVVDAFVAVGVSPEQLVEYLGHALDLIQPAELAELRDIHAALKDGETRWAAVMEEKRAADPVRAPEALKPVVPARDLAEDLKASIAQEQARQATASSGPVASEPPPVPLSPPDELLAAIDRASKPGDLNPLAARIGKLADADKARVTAAYSLKAKALRGGAR